MQTSECLRMTMKIVIFAFCVGVVQGCGSSPGLLPNGFDNVGQSTLVQTGRDTDTNTDYAGAGGFKTLTFVNDIQIMRANQQYKRVKLCDNGVVVFGLAAPAGITNCPFTAGINSVGNTHGFAFLVADYIFVGAGGSYLAESYYILRSDQYDARGNATGPSICDLEKIAAIVTDCDETHRLNVTVLEAAVLTWKVTATGFTGNYIYQVIVAVVDDGSGVKKTRIAFLYRDRPNVAGFNNRFMGEIHAHNAGITPPESRYSVICNAVGDLNVYQKSNCRCAQKGHYVFDTMESTVAPVGYCGNKAGRKTCNQDLALDDGMTLNRNCIIARTPMDSCDLNVRCLQNMTANEIVLEVKNTGATGYAFLNYTRFTETTSGTAGFTDPHGDNIQGILVSNCNGSITPTNTTYRQITVPSFAPTSTSPCVEYDSTTKSVGFVLALYDKGLGFNITTYKSKIYVGHCNLGDLPEYINLTAQIGPVVSTVVPPRNNRALTIAYWDRRSSVGRQTFTSGSTVTLGRPAYIAICYTPVGGTPPTPYVKNADPYAAYGYECQLSNSPDFVNSGDKRTMPIMNSAGCRIGTTLADSFMAPSTTPTFTGSQFCVVSGMFRVFRWKMGEKKLYLRCKTNFCTNTQLYPFSKCKDTCSNTIVDANVTDVGSDRKKRDVDDEGEELYMVVDVVSEAEAASKDCADDGVVKTVIGALVSLLVIATATTVILFCMFQKQK